MAANNPNGGGAKPKLAEHEHQVPRRLKNWRNQLLGRSLVEVFEAPRALDKMTRIDPVHAERLANVIHMVAQKKPVNRVILYLFALKSLIPRMLPAKRASWSNRVLSNLADKDAKLREATAEIAGDLIGLNAEEHRLAFYQTLENRLEDKVAPVRAQSIRSLGKAFGTLPEWARPEHYEAVEKRLNDKDWEVAMAARNFLEAMAPSLKPDTHADAIERMIERLFGKKSGFRDNLTSALSMIQSLDRNFLPQLLLDLLGNYQPAELPPELWKNIVKGMKPHDLEELATTNKPNLQFLIDFHSSGLPWVDYFWKQYLEDLEPIQIVGSLGMLLRQFRRGQAPRGEEYEFRLAHAALDIDTLSYETFLARAANPYFDWPFLDHSFQARIWNSRSEAREEIFDVGFSPSKNVADQFFPRLGNLTRERSGSEILEPDFQIYRMIAKDRIQGVIEVQRAWLDGKKVMILAVHPQWEWRVDSRQLLSVIVRNFTAIAKKEGYDAVLFPKDPKKQSAREHMQKAFAARNFPTVRFSEPLREGEYAGRQFLAAWRRPRR